MATVYDSLDWATWEAEFRAYVGIPTGSDDRLERLFESGKRAADHYMNNPFVDDDGVDIPIPGEVIEGVFAWSKVILDSSGTTGPASNVKMLKVGDNRVQYGGSSSTDLTPGQRAVAIAAAAGWDYHRKDIWR